uniref:Enoyl reductase (ER) domain-containing protein n=1 Tax=Eutreptiella gymnastica TaxID=73025 RepID=A0A7S1N6U9_9EUGL
MALPQCQTQVVLAQRPTAEIVPGEHLVTSTDVPVPHPAELLPDQLLIHNLWISLDPAMRGWMNDRKSYIPPVKLGHVMRASAVGEVIASRSAKYRPGQLVQGLFGLQEFTVVPAKYAAPCLVPPIFSESTALGVFGITGLTAYFGLLEVGLPRKGETVVVSAAAGATGSVVAQIAKHVIGCRVVGIAGGAQKCDWLLKELGLDAAVDHKAADFGTGLKDACPQGIDVYFDNVGGQVLDQVLRFINLKARVVICGAIAGYNDTNPQPGPSNYFSLLVNRGRMEGFIVFDYSHQYAKATRDLVRWVQEGKIKHREEVVDGVAAAPHALLKLFSGANTGKLVVRVGPRLTQPVPAPSKL